MTYKQRQKCPRERVGINKSKKYENLAILKGTRWNCIAHKLCALKNKTRKEYKNIKVVWI